MFMQGKDYIRLTLDETESINEHLEYKLSDRSLFKNATVSDFIAQGGQVLVYHLNTPNASEKYVLKIIYDQDNKQEDIANRFEKIIDASARLVEIGCEELICKIEWHFITEGKNKLYCLIEKYRTCLELFHNTLPREKYPELALRLGYSLIVLLARCQDERILFRDIKSGNIFVIDNDITKGFRLGDFGTITHINENGDTTTQNIRGSLPTTAPEWFALKDAYEERTTPQRDYIDISKSDMYSVAATMYYYLNNGSYPFSDPRNRLMRKNQQCPYPENGSNQLKAIVVKALSLYPKDRFGSYKEMLEEIKKTPEFNAYFNSQSMPDQNVDSFENFVAEMTQSDLLDTQNEQKAEDTQKPKTRTRNAVVSFVVIGLIAIIALSSILSKNKENDINPSSDDLISTSSEPSDITDLPVSGLTSSNSLQSLSFDWRTVKTTQLSQTNAQISGTINFSSKVKCSEGGFYIGTNESDMRKVEKPDIVNINSNYINLKFLMSKYNYNLIPDTTYYYKLYVVADGQSYISPTYSFTTPEKNTEATTPSKPQPSSTTTTTTTTEQVTVPSHSVELTFNVINPPKPNGQNAILKATTSPGVTAIELSDEVNGNYYDSMSMMKVDNTTWIFNAEIFESGRHKITATATFEDGKTVSDVIHINYPFS